MASLRPIKMELDLDQACIKSSNIKVSEPCSNLNNNLVSQACSKLGNKEVSQACSKFLDNYEESQSYDERMEEKMETSKNEDKTRFPLSLKEDLRNDLGPVLLLGGSSRLSGKPRMRVCFDPETVSFLCNILPALCLIS